MVNACFSVLILPYERKCIAGHMEGDLLVTTFTAITLAPRPCNEIEKLSLAQANKMNKLWSIVICH